MTQAGTAPLFANWDTFRTTSPLRPFFLVQVGFNATGNGTVRLGIPTNLQTSIMNDPLTRAFIRSQAAAYPVAGEAAFRFTAYDATTNPAKPGNTDNTVFPNGMPRDLGNVALRSDLFDICGLDVLPPGSNVFLFVDDSGSMRVTDVRATLNLLQARCDAAGLVIRSVFSPNENYILPFIGFSGVRGVP